MGCGESKHDVATGNTITRKKSDASSRKSRAVETAKETSMEMEDNKTNPITLVQQEENQDMSKSRGGDDDNVEAVSVSVAVAEDDVKNKDTIIDESKELKELGGTDMERGDGGGGVEEQQGGRLISKESPNHFFSSRKDHEDIEGLAYEGRSENSEYCSPRVESSANSKENPFNETVKLDDDQQEETLVDQARKPETENEEAVIAIEENLGQEAEPVMEPEVSSTTTVKEEHNAKQEELTSYNALFEKLGTSPTAEDQKDSINE